MHPSASVNLAALKFTQPARVQPEYIEPLRAIMFEAFPPSERVDFGLWLNGFAEGRRLLFLAEMHRIADVDVPQGSRDLRSATRLVGFATVHPWVTADVHLLGYLAVAREYRGKNYGAALLQQVVASVRALGKAEGIILEVESDDVGTAAERDLRKRRIGFYERNGGHIVDCAPRFRVPNMIPGGEPQREKLMWIPLGEHTETPRGAKLRECIIGLYTQDYGRAADDELLLEVLNNLAC